MMGLHSCSKKKCGGGADCLAAVDLSVFLKLPACLFVCAHLFPCFPSRSLGLSASWRVLEYSTDTRNTPVAFLSLCFSFVSNSRKTTNGSWLSCVFQSCFFAVEFLIPSGAVEQCFDEADMDSQYGRTQSGFWWETANVNKIVLVDNEISTGYLFKCQTVAPRLGRFRYCVCVCMRTCCVLISQTRPHVEDELRVGYLQAAGHL